MQNVLDYYCNEYKAAPVPLASFLNYTDPNNVKLSIKNYFLDEPTAKAIACVLPFMLNITELELHNNQLTDSIGGMIVLAFFMNPMLTRLTICYNYMRSTFTKSLAKLIAAQPCKITHLNVMGSISFNDHIEPLARSMPSLMYL